MQIWYRPRNAETSQVLDWNCIELGLHHHTSRPNELSELKNIFVMTLREK